MTRLSAAYGRFLDALAVAAALILFGMVALVTADILLRNLTRIGFAWAYEISEYALYLMTLLVAPWLLRRGQHVRLDLVLMAVPARAALVFEMIADLVGLAICLILMRYGLAITLESARLGSITIKNLVFPEWWLLAPLPVAFLLLALEFVFRMHRLGEGGRRQDATSVG